MKLLTSLLFIGLALSAPPTVADEIDELIQQYERDIKERLRQEQIERIKEANRNALERSLNRAHTKFSDSIFSVSDSIDEFFAGERTEEEKNGSRIKISYETLMVENRDPLYNFRLSTRLVLPRTQDKLNFLLQSLEDDLTEDSSTPGTTANFKPLEEEKRQSFFAGLKFKGVQEKEWHISTDAGVKLVWPPDPFAKLRLRRSFFWDPWELRLTENVFWFESEGWWQVAAVELERPFKGKNLLRWGNFGTRRDDIGYWNFNHFVGWYHQASKVEVLGYSAGVTADEEPAYGLTSYYLSISYRRNLWEEWVFFDLAPTASWPRAENFTFVPSLRVKIEVVFGSI